LDPERQLETAEFARKADGRRVFTVDFKRETVARIVSGEKTLAELSRELGISPSVLRNWMRLVERGGTTAVAAGEDVVPASRVRELEQQVKELQRLAGKQAMTIEILEAAREVVKKSPHLFKGSGR
jgi:transposase